MDISQRKLNILAAIIEDYVATGIPVGSRTISKKPGVEVSSATIRNEMADLEDMGLLGQPHTSAGRVPSDAAYRLYVDRLMRVSQLTPAEAADIRAQLNTGFVAMEDVIKKTADVLSEMTDQISVVLSPTLDHEDIRRIQLVKLSENRVLLLVVTSSGLVRESVLSVQPGLDSHILELLSNRLTELSYDKKLPEAAFSSTEPVMAELSYGHEFMDTVLAGIAGAVGPKKGRVVLGGAKNIFNFPEYHDVDRARNFLEVLETKDMLELLLRRAREMEFTIRIGAENEFDEFRDMALVTATYKIGGQTVGSFGVLGPTRMDYGKTVAVLKHVGNSLNDILRNYIDNK